MAVCSFPNGPFIRGPRVELSTRTLDATIESVTGCTVEAILACVSRINDAAYTPETSSSTGKRAASLGIRRLEQKDAVCEAPSSAGAATTTAAVTAVATVATRA